MQFLGALEAGKMISAMGVQVPIIEQSPRLRYHDGDDPLASDLFG